MVRTTKRFDCKKAVLLKQLVEPGDVPEDIGEIENRNKDDMVPDSRDHFLKTFVI